MLRIVRFRSRDRDLETDAAREGAVRRQIETALASIDRELAGVGKRLDEASDWACSAMGNEDGIYAAREPAAEKQLREAEQAMKFGSARLLELRRRRAMFERMLAVMDEAPGAS